MRSYILDPNTRLMALRSPQLEAHTCVYRTSEGSWELQSCKLKHEDSPVANFYSCSASHAFNNINLFATTKQFKFSRYRLIHKARGYIPLNRKLWGEERE